MGDERRLLDGEVLGRCPTCETTIPPEQLLATYEAGGDWPRMLAECPDCVDVVSPV